MSKTTEKQIKATVPVYDNNVGIRATLNNMGFSDNRVGYDEKTGTVLLDGKGLIRPAYMDEDKGVSYASNSDIQKSLVNYFKNSDNPIVRVSDAYSTAAGKYGLSADALSYGNGSVMIGGKPLNTLYNDESGKSWAWQSDVDAATRNYIEQTGVKSPEKLYDDYKRHYMSDIEDMISDLKNREEFSYNPDDDPVYLAYKKKYAYEGSRASENAMSDYSSLTGGYVNSAAVTAGAMAEQYYGKQLTDKIPELAEAAYKRYSEKYQRDADILSAAADAYNNAYRAELDANSAAAANANSVAKSSTVRDENEYNRRKADYDWLWEDKKNRQSYNAAETDSYWDDIFNSQKQLENAVKVNGMGLDNEQKSVYLEYYRRLLETELEGNKLENSKTVAETYALYNK